MSALQDVIKNIILFECNDDDLYNRVFVVSALHYLFFPISYRLRSKYNPTSFLKERITELK